MRRICWPWCVSCDFSTRWNPLGELPEGRGWSPALPNVWREILASARREEQLSRRPVKRAASQHVDMQVEHRLPRPGAVIDHGAIALRFQPPLTRQLSRQQKKMAEQ